MAMTIRSLLLIYLLGVQLQTFAQDISPYLKNFGAQVHQNDVYLEWTTRVGFSCEDVVVEHGTDSGSLIPVYTWPGICGSQSSEERYVYTFTSLGAGSHYFRLDLGLTGKSHILSAYINPRTNTASVIPSPAGPESILYWQNNFHQSFNVNLYNSRGVPVYQTVTDQDMLPLKSILLLPGMYSYRIVSPNQVYSGKFLVH